MKLVDPVDRGTLSKVGDDLLVSESGHEYPIIQGVPILLVRNAVQTHGAATATVNLDKTDPLFLETIGITPDERAALKQFAPNSPIDPVVQFLIAHTNGRLYRGLVGKLHDYPIPHLRLPSGEGRTFLDIGSNWGRWSIAAARKGYKVTAIDPSLGAALAGRRVAKQLGLDIEFVVGDARFPPFENASFDACFSYGVLQHFSRDNAGLAIAEIGRVLSPGSSSLVQMPNKFGLVCIAHQALRGFSDGKDFSVRYWRPKDLMRLFASAIGRSRLSVDGFFGLGIQYSDMHRMPPIYAAAIRLSEYLRKASEKFTPMVMLADSIYVHSVKHQ